ncbi:MAG: RHS repeat-associated core domain-containing protein [Armatimonadota bacterium]
MIPSWDTGKQILRIPERFLDGLTSATPDYFCLPSPRTWLAAGSKSYGYDAAGRTTSVTNGSSVTNLSYDWESRLTSLSGATTASYAYNGLDTRVSKIEGGVTTNYVRDGIGVTAPVIRDTFASYTPGTSEKRGTTTTFLHSGLKNAEMQTDSAKAVSATKQYDAFGNAVASTGTWQGAFGYAGGFGYQEDASGLKLLGHRYYDASTGRFLTRDPAQDGRNWYVYCESAPLTNYDDLGLGVVRIVASIAGGLIGGIISGGNPIGAGVGAGLGGAIGSALEQYLEKGEVDATEAIIDGVTDGVTSYVGGKLLTGVMAKLMPVDEIAPGVVGAIHNTNPGAAEGIIKEGFKDGVIYAWPRPVSTVTNFIVGSGTNTGGEVMIEVPADMITRNMWGAIVIK